jgi:hypothetical protein
LVEYTNIQYTENQRAIEYMGMFIMALMVQQKSASQKRKPSRGESRNGTGIFPSPKLFALTWFELDKAHFCSSMTSNV